MIKKILAINLINICQLPVRFRKIKNVIEYYFVVFIFNRERDSCESSNNLESNVSILTVAAGRNYLRPIIKSIVLVAEFSCR